MFSSMQTLPHWLLLYYTTTLTIPPDLLSTSKRNLTKLKPSPSLCLLYQLTAISIGFAFVFWKLKNKRLTCAELSWDILGNPEKFLRFNPRISQDFSSDILGFFWGHEFLGFPKTVLLNGSSFSKFYPRNDKLRIPRNSKESWDLNCSRNFQDLFFQIFFID